MAAGSAGTSHSCALQERDRVGGNVSNHQKWEQSMVACAFGLAGNWWHPVGAKVAP